MKQGILAALGMTFALFAGTAHADSMTALECTGTRGDETVTFDIVNWGTPNAVLYQGANDRDGAGLVSLETAQGVTRVSFSNECDNLFVLILGVSTASDAAPQLGVADYYTDGRENDWARLSLTCSWNNHFSRSDR
jgi:hypothetical protein